MKPEEQRAALIENHELDTVVALAAAPPSGTEGGESEPFEILRTGNFDRGGRKVPVTVADLDAAVSNFARWQQLGQDVPVDYDHSFAEGKGSAAAGWYQRIWRDGERLMATVKWTSDAAAKIRAGVYRFFSPEWARDWKSETGDSEGFTIVAGGLTNRPFLRGMKPVALSQDVQEAGMDWASDAYEQLADAATRAAAAGAPGVAPEGDETLSSVPDKLTVKIDGEDQEFSPEQVAELVEKTKGDGEESTTLSVKIGDETQTFTAEQVVELHGKAAKADASDRQLETMSKRLEKVETDRKNETFNQLIERKRGEGRVDATDEARDDWRETFDAIGLEKTEALIDRIPRGTIPVTERGRGTDAGPPAARGVDADRHAMDQKIQARAQEKGIDYTEAMDQLVAEGAIA